jgi:hypothetical protein
MGGTVRRGFAARPAALRLTASGRPIRTAAAGPYPELWAINGPASCGGIMFGSLFGVVYFIIGLVVAFTHGYALTSVGELLSFILAVLLWPLVLFGFNLHIAI